MDGSVGPGDGIDVRKEAIGRDGSVGVGGVRGIAVPPSPNGSILLRPRSTANPFRTSISDRTEDDEMAKRAATTSTRTRQPSTRRRTSAAPPAPVNVAADIEYGEEYIDDAPEYRPAPDVYAEPVQRYYPEEYPVEYPEPRLEQFDEPRSPFVKYLLWGLAAWFFVIANVLILIGIWWWVANSDQPEPDSPAPYAPAELVSQLDRALAGPGKEEAATYLGKYCRGLGAQLRIDAKNSPSDYDTRKELADLVGIAGNRVTSNDQTKAYRDLPRIFEDMQKRAFGDDPMAGPATADDVAKFADEWTALGDAFLAVAE